MQYKTEQKEKFTVITLLENSLSSNLVPELAELTTKIGAEAPKNLVLNFSKVTQWELPFIEQLANAQQAATQTVNQNNTNTGNTSPTSKVKFIFNAQ